MLIKKDLLLISHATANVDGVCYLAQDFRYSMAVTARICYRCLIDCQAK